MRGTRRGSGIGTSESAQILFKGNIWLFRLHIKREGILRKMRVREKVIKMIEELPEDITVSDIMAELYLRQNVDEGLKELDEGKGVSHEEAKRRLNRWIR